jgi:hypothetical protein
MPNTLFSGQYLYRNNPRFAASKLKNEAQSCYQAGIVEVTSQLKTRNFDIETNKRAKLRAEEISRKQKDQEEIVLKIANEQGRSNLVKEILPQVFNDWTASLLRSVDNAFLKRSEVVSVYIYLIL